MPTPPASAQREAQMDKMKTLAQRAIPLLGVMAAYAAFFADYGKRW